MSESISVESLAKRFTIKPDLDELIVDDASYYSCLSRPLNELSQWLYCVLHAGNENLLKISSREGDLNEEISNSVHDYGINVPSKKVNLFNKVYKEVGGLRINDNSQSSFVHLPSFRPNLTPGFFMYVYTNEFSTKRHYIGATNSKTAIEVWSKGITNLLKENVSFSAKVLSNASSYPRNDAVVFYSNKDTRIVEKVLLNIVAELDGKIPLKGSPFTEKLLGTLARAEQPLSKNGLKQSFGEHRCNNLAAAIKDSLLTGVDLAISLKQRFRLAGINLENISLNATTLD